jgi:type IV pilus assembly protein PilW
MRNIVFHSRMRRQRGVSLIELMISLTLSLVIIAGVLYVFLGSRQSYNQMDVMSRLQENGRIAVDLLTHDLRLGGYMGCRRYGANTVSVIADNPPFQETDIVDSQAIRGVTYTAGSPAYVTDSLGNAGVVNSDVIVIRHAAADGVRLGGGLATQLGQGSTTITLTPTGAAPSRIPGDSDGTPLAAGAAGRDLALITDCSKGDIFRVTAVAGGTTGTPSVTITSNAGLSWGYGPDAVVFPFREDRYFLRDTGRLNRQNQPVISLYRMAAEMNPDNAEELVEGVTDMRMEYGVDSDGDDAADVYMAVNAVTNWAQVVSVRVRLMLATVDDNTLTEDATFTLLDANTVTDRRLRQEYDAVVAFRNRLQ